MLSIDLDEPPVKVPGEPLLVFRCGDCRAEPSRKDELGWRVMSVIMKLMFGLRLPYFSAFMAQRRQHVLGSLACTCPAGGPGTRPVDACFICGWESGRGTPEDHVDYILINRFSRLKSFASIMVSIEHEAAHAAGLADDEEMVRVERQASECVARVIPDLPPANKMLGPGDTHHPSCPRGGTLQVLAETYAAQMTT